MIDHPARRRRAAGFVRQGLGKKKGVERADV